MCVTEKVVILKETISPHARRVTCTVIPQILSLPCLFLLLFLKNSSLLSDIVEFLLAGLLTDTADVSPVCLTATSVLVQRAGEASYWNVREKKPNVPG